MRGINRRGRNAVVTRIWPNPAKRMAVRNEGANRLLQVGLGLAVALSPSLVWYSGASLGAQAHPWMNQALTPDERARLLVAAMSLEDKIHQVAMRRVPNDNLPNCGLRNDSRQIQGIPRLDIPTVRMTNGPIGVGGGDCAPDPKATGVPAAIAVAASWNPEISTLWGDIVGAETRGNAHHVFLAPGVNLARVPHNGRNFEYFGEDPYLAGVMAVAQIRAVQGHGVQAVAKHYVANEQETDRQSMNVIVDERTLQELYLLPFEMSIRDAGLAAVMCSYPRINGYFSCEHAALLNGVLRQQWGFDGYVMSDRGATHSVVPAIRSGLDLEFATPVWFTPERIGEALAANNLAVADLDAMLLRRFRTMFRLGQFDVRFDQFTPIDLTLHANRARAIGEQGVVLLRNTGVLPLNAAGLRRIAVFGAPRFAGQAKLPATGPRGFITVNVARRVSPVEGLTSTLSATGSGATVTYDQGTDLQRARDVAMAADVAIVMVGDESVEAADRSSLALPEVEGVNQDALIRAVAAANRRTVVVLKTGGAVLMPWLKSVPAVLEAWFPGQEDGSIVADVLFGATNPSGKLPLTFPRRDREAGAATPSQWPGLVTDGGREATYSERLSVGYRWYQATRTAPLFPFGFGLSYTTFAISDIAIVPAKTLGGPFEVRLRVSNTGRRAGAEVAQVYVELPRASGEPGRRLVQFQRVQLNAGQSQTIGLVVDPASSNHPLSVWDASRHAWVMPSGEYLVYVGNSSQQVKRAGSFRVGG